MPDNQTPIKVENIQYNVNVGTVKSKVGLASTLTAVFGWITALMVICSLLALISILLKPTPEDVLQAKNTLVFAIAVLVPILPLFIFSVKRLNKSLKENQANLDDLFFKKSIRFNLILGLIISCFWSITLVYNILAKIILQNDKITLVTILNNIAFLLPPAIFLYFFWTYQQKTKR